ncbi:MAG: 2Fe-2S ferredoxin-type protein [Candidatus Hydrogenedentes bacterium]|nr:2Fe-2S ferredoxin-type protein [Candidatus Hydrogenedentota bacterium]
MSMRLTIDHIEVEAPEGATLLEAARLAGVEIPTLCYDKQAGAIVSCMICVVRDTATGRLLPACAVKAIEGMDIDTRGEEVIDARREILRLLLDEHAGDCEGPCTRICPASLDIPRMLRRIASGDVDGAARIAKRDLIFPATLGYLCTAPCEKGCRRGVYDEPIAIRRSHREVAERALRDGIACDEPAAPSGKRVAVVGTGLAGLAAAWECLRHGHACRVYEKEHVACPAIRLRHAEQMPIEILDAEVELVRILGAEFVYGCEADAEALAAEFDAVILACDASVAPRGNVFSAKEDKMFVRSVAHGKEAARRADAFLRNAPDGGGKRPFASFLGKLQAGETARYAVERLNSAGSGGMDAEASRCLHCDCAKPVSCKLRQYAEAYGLGSHVRHHADIAPLEAIQSFGEVLYESGKCIKCGICVEIARGAGVDMGMTFMGRGLAERVCVPFGESLARGLGAAAERCVEACPTGALAFRSGEDAP